MTTQNNQQRERILVVDGDRTFWVAAKTLLEDEHSIVTLASGGKEALCVTSAMMRYAWQENIRERENIKKRAILSTERCLRHALQQRRGNINQVARRMNIDRKSV